MTDEELAARSAELDARSAELDAREQALARREQRTVEAEAASEERRLQRLEQLPAARAAREQEATAAAALAAGPQTIRFGGLAASSLAEGNEPIPELGELTVETEGSFTLVRGLPGELVALAEALARRNTEPARRAAVCVYTCLRLTTPLQLVNRATG